MNYVLFELSNSFFILGSKCENFKNHEALGRYFMYYYGIYYGDNIGSIIDILSPIFYVLDILTTIY